MTTLSLSPGRTPALHGPRVRGALDELILLAQAVIEGGRMTGNLRRIEPAVRSSVLFASDHRRLDARAWKMLHEALVELDALRARSAGEESRDQRIFLWGSVCAHLLVIAKRDRAVLDDILADDFREEFGSNAE